MNRGYAFETLRSPRNLGCELYEEDESGHFHAVFLAVEHYFLFVQGEGYAFRGAACGEYVVEEGELEAVTVRHACGYVGEAVEDVVGAIFLHYRDVFEVAFREGQLAFLAGGNDIPDFVRDGEQRGGEKEAPGFCGDDVRRIDDLVYVAYETVEHVLVLEERHDVDEVYARNRKILIVFDDFFVHILIYF